MTTITINITGDKEAIDTLQKISGEFKNFSEPLNLSSKKYLNAIATNFKNHGMTFNELWPDLAESTIEIKRKLKAQGKAIAVETPLVRTGLMQKSFGHNLIGVTISNIYNAMSYAITHQEGGTVFYRGKQRKVPMRILADVDDERIEMVRLTFTDWIDGLINKYKAG